MSIVVKSERREGLGKNAARPIVFALSNPTSSCEAQPADILAWTEGRAIVATGSPFEPVEHAGKKHFIGQGNNAFIFPGLGFGAILAQATEITDGMVMAASQGLSDYTAERHLSAGLVYPPVAELREVAVHVAARVIAQAFQDGVARSAKVAPENLPSVISATESIRPIPDIMLVGPNISGMPGPPFGPS